VYRELRPRITSTEEAQTMNEVSKSKDRGIKFAGPVLVAAVVGIVLFVNAGDLTPPPGPVAPTMKTLTQVEPRTPVQDLSSNGTALYVIDQPGSYYLTANITGVSGKHGIEVTAENVTLDLNGFALLGVPGSQTGVAVSASNVAVHEGTVRDWGAWGVYAPNCSNIRLENLLAADNGSSGLAAGPGCTVVNCNAVGNQAAGIIVSSGSVIGCTARSNGWFGIQVTESTVSACTVQGNEDGIVASYSTVSECTATTANSNGIWAAQSTVVNCTAIGNGQNGVYAEQGSTIKDCTVVQNSDAGIEASASIVFRCTAKNNYRGIEAHDGCSVVSNNCANNVNGIEVWNPLPGGLISRIESNHVTKNTYAGISAEEGAIIIKNTADGNQNDDYYPPMGGGGCTWGDVLDFNSGGTITSSNPWANFDL
jgi:hypothetical protein